MHVFRALEEGEPVPESLTVNTLKEAIDFKEEELVLTEPNHQALKKLFEDHYIDVPDEKYDVLEDQASKIEDLEKKLNEQIEKNVEQNKAIGELKRQDIIDEASKDLADTAKEKFNKLAEEVEFSNEEDFTTKVATIKESYFGHYAKEKVFYRFICCCFSFYGVCYCKNTGRI